MKSRPAVLLILAVVVLSACSRDAKSEMREESKQAAPVEVSVAPAQTRQVERTISVTGSLHPDETVSMSFEVAGRVSKVHADFGNFVRAGQPLAELDRREYELQVERSHAALSQALARVGLNPSQEDALPTESAAIRQARAQFEEARSRFENAEKLVASGDISRERHTELQKQMLARKAAVDASEDDLRTQLANIQALRAEKKLVEKRLNDTVVRAPFDASVAERMVSAGQYLKENTPVFSLVKAHPLRLRLDVPETASAAVRIGDTLRFTTEAAPDKEFTATVRQMNPSLDARSRSLSAEARLTSADGGLRPGMFVQVELVISRNAEIVVVPKEAVYTVAGLTKVFTVKDGRAVEHRITPGATGDNWVEVPAAAIRAGDLVALNQIQSLTDGAEVRHTQRAQ
jgi:RND family efflux transporter MFP subunit